jgi:hypothetical protein
MTTLRSALQYGTKTLVCRERSAEHRTSAMFTVVRQTRFSRSAAKICSKISPIWVWRRGHASMNFAVSNLGISRNPAAPGLLPQTGRATDGLQFGGILLAVAPGECSTVEKASVLETSKLSKPAGALICSTHDEAREFDDTQSSPSHDPLRDPRLNEHRIGALESVYQSDSRDDHVDMLAAIIGARIGHVELYHFRCTLYRHNEAEVYSVIVASVYIQHTSAEKSNLPLDLERPV